MSTGISLSPRAVRGALTLKMIHPQLQPRRFVLFAAKKEMASASGSTLTSLRSVHEIWSLEFQGFDPSGFLISRGGISRSTRNLPKQSASEIFSLWMFADWPYLAWKWTLTAWIGRTRSVPKSVLRPGAGSKPKPKPELIGRTPDREPKPNPWSPLVRSPAKNIQWLGLSLSLNLSLSS